MALRHLHTPLPLDRADAIIDAALAEAQRLELAPLTVVVLDTGGHPLALKRQDGSGIVRIEIATGKAWVALGMGLSSRAIGDVNKERPAFLNALAAASSGRAVPVAGGVLVLNDDGAAIGAVGVSGDQSDNDERCALAGISAAGYAAEPAAER